jgi:hypothetical protein
MSELGHSVRDAMTGGRRLGVLMGIVRVLKCLPRKLVPRKVILLSVLLGDAMGMRRHVVQFGGPLMVFVMRSVVVTSGHIQCPFKDLPPGLT